MKQLTNILNNASIIEIIGNKDIVIDNITFDSRNVEANSMFIAVRGTKSDGHNYIEQTIEKGAVCIVCEVLPSNINKDVTYVLVKDSSFSLGIIASNYYDNPSEQLSLVGITGTNGKTTTVTFLYNLFKELVIKTGFIMDSSVV